MTETNSPTADKNPDKVQDEEQSQPAGQGQADEQQPDKVSGDPSPTADK